MSSADLLSASGFILAAPGIKGLSWVGERTGGVPGSGASLNSSSNSESESAASATGWRRAVCKDQLLPGLIPDSFFCKPLGFSVMSGGREIPSS